MDVTAALFTVAVTVGTLAPAGPSVANTEAPIAAAVSAIAEPRAAASSVDGIETLPNLRLLSARGSSSKRPGALIPLYASFAVLQGFDICTTSAAVKRGGVEANPAMQPVAGNKLASTAVKAAATAGGIYFIERAWKQNRKGAVVLATVINVATAAVVAHNTRVAK
jgi:hypothetical protein